MADSRTIIAAFTEMAARYEQTVDRELRQFWGIGYHQFIDALLDRLDFAGAGAVLDVATGRGVVPLTLAGRPGWSGHVVGIDITPEMLRGARQATSQAGLTGRIRLVCGSGERLPFGDNSFDTAICALATHHMQVTTLLQELNRVLRPGGQLLLADVALADFWRSRTGRVVLRVLAWWYGRREGAARLRAELEALPNMRAPEQWADFLLACGFSDLQVTAVPARRAWYPPGILARAISNKSVESTER
jgi:ubiquinone/menaquinone biosynthesis C-methylase UbiE